MLEPIQSLWWGRLSVMERLCAASYIANGHRFHLYTYGARENVPEGVILKDGNEIVPETDQPKFRYLAHFADWFRYNLLVKRGGWWVDMDTVCLRPFDAWGPLEHVIPQQDDRAGGFAVNNAYLKAPAASPVMVWLVRRALAVDRHNMAWEATANTICLQAVAKFGIPAQVSASFNPIPWWEWKSLTDHPEPPSLPAASYAVHLWHAMWRQSGKDPDMPYEPECLYEQLKRRYAAVMGVK
jgi:hypothetical protein